MQKQELDTLGAGTMLMNEREHRIGSLVRVENDKVVVVLGDLKVDHWFFAHVRTLAGNEVYAVDTILRGRNPHG